MAENQGRTSQRQTNQTKSGGKPRSRKPRESPVSPSRLVAYEVIAAVREQAAYANLLLPNRIERANLSAADAALATELTYGTLRMQGFYDAVISLVTNSSTQLDPEVLDILRLGVHQLLSTRIPSHAAVNEQVELARRFAPAATGFVNAVLRKIARANTDQWRDRVVEGLVNADSKTAARYSHPEWVVRAFRAGLEREGRGAELTELLNADNISPQMNLVVLSELQRSKELGRPNKYSPVGFTADRPLEIIAKTAGEVRVQDEGSQLAALALARARPIVPGERWLDLCAGPGGKTALLAKEALAGGASLTANELVPARADLVRKAIAAVPLEVQVLVGDGRQIRSRLAESNQMAVGFDRILVDAPCTGLGALRRRPEARWRKQPGDVAELTAIQGELLGEAFEALAPGGVLAYVTCSPHPAETSGVINTALARWGERALRINTRKVVEQIALAPLDLAGPVEHVQLWPHRHDTDAMFIVLLGKVDRL